VDDVPISNRDISFLAKMSIKDIILKRYKDIPTSIETLVEEGSTKL
jgi:hypothetical protein